MKNNLKTEFSTLRYPTLAVTKGVITQEYICPYHQSEADEDQRSPEDGSILDRLYSKADEKDEWQYIKGCKQCQQRYDYQRFGDYDYIKYHYEIAVGYLGRWLAILERWYCDDAETLQWTKDFLQWAVISENVFLEQTKEVREGQEYQAWLEKQKECDSDTPLGRQFHEVGLQLAPRGTWDGKWRAITSDKQCYSGSLEHAARLTSQIRQEFEEGRYTDNREAERKRFAASNLKQEHSRTEWMARVFDQKTFSVNRPWLFEEIKKRIHAWQHNGRSEGFDRFVQREKEEVVGWASAIKLDRTFDEIYGIRED